MHPESGILAKLKTGDPAAYNWIYQNCYRSATAYIRSRNGTEEDAEDCFQEALLVLVEKLRDPQFDLRVRCATFLHTVVRNLWLYQQRKRGRMLSATEAQLLEIAAGSGEEYGALLEEIEVQETRLQQVLEALDQLGEDCRQVLLLRFYQNMDEGEIAAVMNYQREFVKVKRSRCLGRLRELLGL